MTPFTTNTFRNGTFLIPGGRATRWDGDPIPLLQNKWHPAEPLV
jgi:hypothetical protein